MAALNIQLSSKIYKVLKLLPSRHSLIRLQSLSDIILIRVIKILFGVYALKSKLFFATYIVLFLGGG